MMDVIQIFDFGDRKISEIKERAGAVDLLPEYFATQRKR